MTEQKKLQRQMAQADRLSSMGMLAASVAHEINNPLGVILNFGELVLDHADEGESVRGFARNIIQESERVANIVKNLLAFSRPTRATGSAVRVDDIVERTLSLMRVLLRKDRISVDVDIAPQIPPIRCEAQQIQQVLMNLLTNARDALRECPAAPGPGRSILVTGRVVDKDGAPFRVRLSVHDNGPGIHPDLVATLFQPFQTTKSGGTGLGLSISQGIVRDHGGELWFETERGGGTTFHVDLPLVGNTEGIEVEDVRDAGSSMFG